MPDERPSASLPLWQACSTWALFSLTALAPLLMGFDPNVSILFSGSATLIILTTVLAVGVGAVNAVGTTGNRARFRRRTSLLVLFRDDHPGYSTYETRVDQLSLTSRSSIALRDAD
jgi:hypothetical protein